MFKMLESSVLRYCVYGSCVIISSELLYHSYFWLKNKLENRSSADEVCEVIWTNELTQSCAGRHFANNGKKNGNASPVPSSSGRVFKLPVLLKANESCENAFCAAKHFGRLIELIDSAKYSIDLAMYTFTSFELSQAFVRALQRGVFIRIVSDHEMAYSTGSQIIQLTKAGVPVRCNSNTAFMHHKFCILDSPTRVAELHKKLNKIADKGPIRGIVMTGSLNWTNQGFGSNFENILISSNVKYVSKYSDEFERLWRVLDVDLK